MLPPRCACGGMAVLQREVARICDGCGLVSPPGDEAPDDAPQQPLARVFGCQSSRVQPGVFATSVNRGTPAHEQDVFNSAVGMRARAMLVAQEREINLMLPGLDVLRAVARRYVSRYELDEDFGVHRGKRRCEIIGAMISSVCDEWNRHLPDGAIQIMVGVTSLTAARNMLIELPTAPPAGVPHHESLLAGVFRLLRQFEADAPPGLGLGVDIARAQSLSLRAAGVVLSVGLVPNAQVNTRVGAVVWYMLERLGAPAPGVDAYFARMSTAGVSIISRLTTIKRTVAALRAYHGYFDGYFA
jgi:hypothetical protein